MIYRRFEDIPVWQMARRLVNDLYRVTKDFGKDFSLIDQLKRSSYSIVLNIAEGFERGSNKEFANFINIAKGSAGEVRAILYLAKDRGYISNDELKKFFKEVEEISKQLSKFRIYLLKSR